MVTKKRVQKHPNFVARLPAETRAQLAALAAEAGESMAAALCRAVDVLCRCSGIDLPAGVPLPPGPRPRAVEK